MNDELARQAFAGRIMAEWITSSGTTNGPWDMDEALIAADVAEVVFSERLAELRDAVNAERDAVVLWVDVGRFGDEVWAAQDATDTLLREVSS